MAHEKLSINIEASCDNVFAVLHDYTKRLEWDPLLSDARILDGATQAAKGVRTICTGKWKQLWISMITEYISFNTGKLAAVQAVNKPLFFDRFAASIRHIPLAEGRSRVE